MDLTAKELIALAYPVLEAPERISSPADWWKRWGTKKMTGTTEFTQAEDGWVFYSDEQQIYVAYHLAWGEQGKHIGALWIAMWSEEDGITPTPDGCIMLYANDPVDWGRRYLEFLANDMEAKYGNSDKGVVNGLQRHHRRRMH